MIAEGSNEMKTALTDHLARLWRYGLVLSGKRDVAEDLVRRTCVRALEEPRDFASKLKFDRWLFSILRSIWLNEVRSNENHVSVVDFRNTLAHPILREVLMLGEQEREALFLVYVEELTYRQAAEMLEVPIGTVMTRLATARERAMLTSRPANIFGDASGLC
jgi:RNA polymerase sigma-70 factor (ECF subfamily)